MEKLATFRNQIISLVVFFFALAASNNASSQSLIHPYGSFCVGQMNVFTFTGQGTVTSWYVSGNGTILTTSSNTIQVKWNTPVSSAYVTAYYNGSFGSGSASYYNINIAASVTPSVSITANKNNICPGTAVTFTAAGVNGGTTPYYSWSVDGIVVTGGTNMNVFTSTSLTNGQQVSCSMSTSVACYTAYSANSNPIAMTVVTAPQPMTVAILGNTNVCQNSTASFSASVTNASGTLSYQWKKNGVNVSSSVSGPPPNVLVLNNTAYNNNDVISCVVSSTGCVAPATSNSVTITIVQPQTFTVGVSPSAVFMPPGSNVTFTAFSNFPAYNYQWLMNGTAVAGATASTFTTIANSGAQLKTVGVTASTTETCVTNTTATGTAQTIPFVVSSITGNKTVAPGATEIYTVNWDWDGNYESYADVTWNVTNGTVISSDKHTATIKWNTPPFYSDGVGGINVMETYRNQSASSSISIVNRTQTPPQTCEGFLGPPAIFVDFGRGANPGAPLPNGVTTYDYKNYCAINPGEYTITNTTVGCRSLWLGTRNHTPNDPNGYMMMIDANDKRGEFYRATATGLTTAFRYEFSAWVGNLTSYGQDPYIKFEIYSNGVLLGSSGDISIPYKTPFEWQKVGFMFDLPSNITSVQVVMVNDHHDGDGNDMVVDDISFAPCYTPIIASFSPNPTVKHKEYICANGGTVNLYSWWPTPTIPFASPGFRWQKSTDGGTTWADIPGANSMNFTQTENSSNIYKYRVIAYNTADPSQIVTSNVLTYYVQKMVVEPKTYSSYACAATSITLNPSAYLQYSDPQGPALTYNYVWSPGTYLSNTQIENPTISLPALSPPSVTGPAPPPILYNYNLTVTNTNFGCSASGPQTVAQYNPRKVMVPSAFTPDGDGHNDVFRPINIWDYPGAKFWIYNRWGQVIFYSQGPNYDWDGKYQGIPQDPGVFVWRVEIPGCPGNIYNSSTNDNNPAGTVTLIR